MNLPSHILFYLNSRRVFLRRRWIRLLSALIPVVCLASLVPAHAATQWLPTTPDYFQYQLLRHDRPFDWAGKTGNPALLLYSHRGDALRMESGYSDERGRYRRFVDPANQVQYDLHAHGSRTTGDRRLYSGSFGFRRLELHDRQWISTREHEAAHPFLIGDSTSGMSRYHEIHLTGSYTYRINNYGSVGAQVDYSVDEGMKEVAPKPLSTHRSFGITAGGALDHGPLRWGVHGSFTDREEELRYTEYEGSILDETRLIFFRGYDLPVVQYRNRETRLTRSSRWSYGSHLSWQLSEGLLFHVQYTGSHTSLRIEEDLTRPRDEGYTSARTHHLEADLLWSFGSWSVNTGYRYREGNRWAEYQPFEALFLEAGGYSHQWVTGFSHRFSPGWMWALEGSLALTDLHEDDYYSQVHWSAEHLDAGFLTGFTTEAVTNLSLTVTYGYQHRKKSGYDLSADATTPYFDEYRRRDIDFQISGFAGHHAGIRAVYALPGDHEIRLDLRGRHLSEMNNSAGRRQVTSQISYRVPLP
ncbi:hypothetical protein QA596_08830 [Balneolales bacterium ANBcel1]|nr:hypothetical protein [Balneolales bacterium ANBcel1]